MKLTRGISMVAALGAVLVLAACQTTPADVGDAKTTFCNSLKTLDTALQKVKALAPTSTVEEAQTAKQDLQTAWDDTTKAAANMQEVQIDATKQAFDEISTTMSGISDQSTLAGAVTTLQASVAKFELATKAINTTVCGMPQ